MLALCVSTPGLATQETLKHAIMHKGEGLNLGAIICKVQESP